MENKPKPKVVLPSIERAIKDLEKYECSHRVSEEKLAKISNEVENLKVQKQALKMDIEEQKRILKYYTDFHVEMATKIEKTLISNNKAKLVKLSNEEKIKQIAAKTAENAFNWNIDGFQIQQGTGLEAAREALSLQKQALEQIIADNNKHMEQLLNKFR